MKGRDIKENFVSPTQPLCGEYPCIVCSENSSSPCSFEVKGSTLEPFLIHFRPRALPAAVHLSVCLALFLLCPPGVWSLHGRTSSAISLLYSKCWCATTAATAVSTSSPPSSLNPSFSIHGFIHSLHSWIQPIVNWKYFFEKSHLYYTHIDLTLISFHK